MSCQFEHICNRVFLPHDTLCASAAYGVVIPSLVTVAGLRLQQLTVDRHCRRCRLHCHTEV